LRDLPRPGRDVRTPAYPVKTVQPDRADVNAASCRVVRQFQRQPQRSPRSPRGIPMVWLGGLGVLGGLRQL